MNTHNYEAKNPKHQFGLIIVSDYPDAPADYNSISSLSKFSTAASNELSHSTRMVSTLPDISGSEVAFSLDRKHDEDYRHWSPTSQPYASADVLLQYLRERWQIYERVEVVLNHCVSRQCIETYNFVLIRDAVYFTMPVLANPVVLRLTRELGLILVRVDASSENP
jgi:hypothetical protein